MRRARGAAGGERERSPAAPPAAPDDPDPSGVRIRTATAADLDAIVALRLALLREHAGNAVYGRLRADAPERARRLFAAQLASSREATFLAERAADAPPPGERVVGILRCMEAIGSPLLEPERYGYVASVYVVPAARGAGVLRRLLAAAEAWCARHGLDEIRLHSAADNVSGNGAWAALGFEIAEHLRVRRLVRPG